MTLQEFMTKYQLSGCATARLLLVTEGAVRHWLDGSRKIPAHIDLLLYLLDDYHTRKRRWPEL